MDYKKKYKDALERARKINSGEGVPSPPDWTTCELIFPELLKSKDERIRKSLINLFKIENFNGYTTLNGIDVDDVITWLEKQGNKSNIFIWNNASDEPEEMQELLLEWESEDATWHEVGFYHQNDKTYWDGERKIDNVTRWCYIEELLEKQGEQKSIDDLTQQEAMDVAVAKCFEQGEQKLSDKVEPKFHEGDWVVQGYNILKIKCVGGTHYCFETVGGYVDDMLISEIDSLYHLWTIQDAEDGDVLVYNNSSVEIILLFKKWMNGVGDGAYSYACTFNNEILFNDWSDCGYTTHPATKEQRDLLFSKMKEAGYEWDADKKELRKIENIQVLSNSLNIGKISKWSDEDEELLQHCCGAIVAADYYTLKDKEEMENWLKSLKQRMDGEYE